LFYSVFDCDSEKIHFGERTLNIMSQHPISRERKQISHFRNTLILNVFKF